MSVEYIEIEDAKLLRSNENAGLYEIDGESYWLPWSAIGDGSVDKDGETGTIYLIKWMANWKGI